MKNTIYKITVLNWEAYNQHHKKGYKKILIPVNFTQDAKLRTLSMTNRWFFLNLLMTCADHARDTVELASNTIRNILECNRNIDGVLDQLQSLQLVRYEKCALIKRIELKEKNGIEEKSSDVRKPKPDKAIEKLHTDQNRQIKNAYIEAYRVRYGLDPATQNATFNSQVSALRKKLGVDESISVVKFYLTHNNSFYLKNTHTFGYCLKDAETLRTQMLKGKAITNTMVRSFEKSQETQELFNRIDEEGI